MYVYQKLSRAKEVIFVVIFKLSAQNVHAQFVHFSRH